MYVYDENESKALSTEADEMTEALISRRIGSYPTQFIYGGVSAFLFDYIDKPMFPKQKNILDPVRIALDSGLKQLVNEDGVKNSAAATKTLQLIDNQNHTQTYLKQPMARAPKNLFFKQVSTHAKVDEAHRASTGTNVPALQVEHDKVDAYYHPLLSKAFQSEKMTSGYHLHKIGFIRANYRVESHKILEQRKRDDFEMPLMGKGMNHFD